MSQNLQRMQTNIADSIKIVDRIYLVNIRYDLLHFNTDSRFEYMSPLDGAAQRQDRLVPQDDTDRFFLVIEDFKTTLKSIKNLDRFYIFPHCGLF